MKVKGSLRRISIEMRSHIFEAALKDENRGKTRSVLADELEVEFGDKSPSLDTLMKLISQARNHPVSDLDSQWSVGCLAKYDIPPEALAVVLSIYEQRLRTEEYSFTIREALWIARLHKVIDDPIFLERFASAYALRDKIDWILENPIYTRGFDFKLLNYSNPGRRAEIVKKFSQFPAYLDSFPSFHPNDSEEITEKLKQKGYDIEPLGMVLLRKHVEQLWLEELPKVLGELKRQWGQKGYVMTPDEESFRNWVEQRWPSVLKEFRERNKQRKGGTK